MSIIKEINKEINKVLFIIFYILSLFFPLFTYTSLTDAPPSQEFFYFSFFIGNIPVLHFIRKGMVYSYVFSLLVLSLIFSFWFVSGEDLWIIAENNIYMDCWQFGIIIILVSIYIGIKLIVSEYINYKNLSLEQKKIERSFKKILSRLLFLFLCLISYIIAIIIWGETNILEWWF